MSRYELAPSALADLLEIVRYSKRTWGAAHAQRYREELELAVERLALSPTMGRKREVIRPGLQSFPVAEHVAFYIQWKNSIMIVRILHPRMNVEEAFGKSEVR